jgi:hypothetical protein
MRIMVEFHLLRRQTLHSSEILDIVIILLSIKVNACEFDVTFSPCTPKKGATRIICSARLTNISDPSSPWQFTLFHMTAIATFSLSYIVALNPETAARSLRCMTLFIHRYIQDLLVTVVTLSSSSPSGWSLECDSEFWSFKAVFWNTLNRRARILSRSPWVSSGLNHLRPN